MSKTARLLCSFAVFLIAVIGIVINRVINDRFDVSLWIIGVLSFIVTADLFSDHINPEKE